MKVFIDEMEDIMDEMECVKIVVQVLGNRVEGFGNIGRDFRDLEKGYFIWMELREKSVNGKIGTLKTLMVMIK
jgi:hypothetical protein